MWWFEIFECVRKLAVACLPVFFQPSGSSTQLIYGLMVCFICFGVGLPRRPRKLLPIAPPHIARRLALFVGLRAL